MRLCAFTAVANTSQYTPPTLNHITEWVCVLLNQETAVEPVQLITKELNNAVQNKEIIYQIKPFNDT